MTLPAQPTARERPRNPRRTHRFRHALPLLVALSGAVSLLAPTVARADDIDIYRTLPPTTKLLTILSLDLNSDPNTVLCNNVLIDPNASGGTVPTDMIPACSVLRSSVTLDTFIGTLKAYLPSDAVEALAKATALSGELNKPIGELSSGATAYLKAALATLGVAVNVADPTGSTVNPNLTALTQAEATIAVAAELAKGLVGGKLALMINHNNLGTATTYQGKDYACGFLDNSTLSPGLRQNTANCSNGAYFLQGFVDLGQVTTGAGTTVTSAGSAVNTADPAGSITAAIAKAMSAALGIGASVLSITAPVPPEVAAAKAPLLPPYQGREVYDEVVHYLGGLKTYNAKLNAYDFAYGKQVTLPVVGTVAAVVSAPVPRDTSIESGNSYVSPLATAPSCDINLVHVQATSSQGDGDSDPDLLTGYDAPDLNGDGQLTYTEMSDAAAQKGFIWNDRRFKLKSYFLIKDSVADALNLKIGNNTVFPFTDTVGLLGSTRAIAKQLNPVFVDAVSMAGTARPNRVDLYATAGSPLYETQFQPAPDQKPNWIGNVKRLELVYDKTASAFNVVDELGSPAYDTKTGRLAPGITTGFVTVAGSSPDGNKVDRGGAGAKIPGYTALTRYDSNGVRTPNRGNPGRLNTEGQRRLYTDQEVTTTVNTGTLALPVQTTVKTLQMVDLNDTDNVSSTNTTTLNLDKVADTIGATSSCNSVTQAETFKAQRRQQAVDAVLYARGFEIGTSTTPVTCSTALTAPTLDHHTSTTTTCPGGGTGCIGARDWMMGAILHSRPVAINYGTVQNPNIQVVFGSADGFLRLIDGASGVERWGFMPAAALAQQPGLRSGAAKTNLPYGVDGAVSVVVIDRDANGGPADGVITPGNLNDSVIVYFGLRRTGAIYYALDITNPALPPRLLWRAGQEGLYRFLPAALSGGTGGYTRNSYADSATLVASTLGTAAPNAAYSTMGLAFSQPGIGKVRLCVSGSTGSGCTLEAAPRTVLLVGGGYNGRPAASATNAGKDINNSTNTTLTPTDQRVGQDDSLGNAVYMIDAASGDIVWRAEPGASPVFARAAPYTANLRLYAHPMLRDSIVAPLNAIDNTGDGLTDRTYFGDLGGRVWRMDLSSADRSAWTLTPLASLGRQATANSFANDRRFSAGIDYVPTRVGNVPYDALVFGSGDREDPRNTVTQNYLYVLFDPDTTNGRVVTDATSYDGVVGAETDTPLFKQARFAACTGTSTCTFDLPKSVTDTGASLNAGWAIRLPDSGQRVIDQPITTSGTILVNSYIPSQIATDSCIPAEGYSVANAYFLGTGTVDTTTLLLISKGNTTQTGGAKSNAILAGGFAGASTPVDAVNILAAGRGGGVRLPVQSSYPTSWRERRGDEP